jgi:DNA-directed RNA polymerase specialized sigma24 family protein
VVSPAVSPDGFPAFFAETEPRLRRALVAAYGPQRGREAAAEALAYAWQHWDRISGMGNAAGYLYRVGQSRTRPRLTPPLFPPALEGGEPWTEPDLPAALEALSERERVATVLIEGFGWTYREVAEMTDLSISSVQSYRERGLRKLRDALGVTEGA